MALLVILGIAVYGVSAFAEEQTATTTPFTINKDYIYLNPTGMKLSDADWTNKNAEIWLNVTKWDEKHKGTYDSNSGYWYWDATNWEIKDGNTYFFTYGTDWGVIIVSHITEQKYQVIFLQKVRYMHKMVLHQRKLRIKMYMH